MGKSLIIKGADFNVNGISTYRKTWYITNGTDYIESIGSAPTNNATSASWTFDSTTCAKIQGKTVNLIRIVPDSAGTFYIYKTSSLSAALSTPAATITTKAADVGILTEYEIDDIEVGAGEYLAFVKPDQTVKMYYAINITDHTFYKRVGFNDYSMVSNFELLIDVGYKEVI